MILDLDAITRDAIAGMCYARWCNAFDDIKKVKALTWETSGKFAPKNEWPLYHDSMIKRAQKELTLAEKLKADICPFSPLVTGE